MKIKVKPVKESRKLRNKPKKERGITLVALIITVVVMLILAGVAISAIVGGEGLFSKVREAVGIYQNAQQKEQEELSNLINEIENYDTIYIYTKEDLEKFRDSVDNGNTYEGKTVMLMNDIDLGGDENDESTWWNPIGYWHVGSPYDQIKAFSGVFEGNNHSINGIYCNVVKGKESIAFFSLIENAIIRNLTVSGDIILGANVGTEISLAGAGLIGNVSGSSTIENCVNRVNVTKLSTGRDAAGFVASVNNEEDVLTIRNCTNYGNITGSNNCGGIIGNVNNGNVIIENTCNKGAITNYLGDFAGGLIGRDAERAPARRFLVINNSYNEGSIKARRDTGGLIGRVYGSISINNCYNNAEIYNEQRTNDSCIGGVVGRIMETSPNCSVINSYNVSRINVENGEGSTNVGGIIGEVRAINTNIINSYNLGNILNGNYVAGICGVAYAPAGTSPIINIKNTYNTGGLSGQNIRGIMIIADDNSPITVNAENVYLLDTVSDVGISNLDASNPIEIPVESLSEENMKSEEFVNELNTNLSSIDMEYDLRRWKYVNGSYPVFE